MYIYLLNIGGLIPMGRKRLLIMMTLLLLLSGCDGSILLDSITLNALYGDTVLDLPIKCQQEGAYATPDSPGSFFTTARDYTEIKSIIERYTEENSGYVTSYDDQILMMFKQNDGNLDYFLFSRINHKQYIISTLRANIYFEGYDTTGEGNYLLLPLFLINDKRIDKADLSPSFYEGVQYELAPDVGINEFAEFFNDSNWFDMEVKNGTLILKSLIASGKISNNKLFQVPHPLIFRFETHVGITYLIIEKGE